LTTSGRSVQTKVFEEIGCRTTSSRISSGNREIVFEIKFKAVEETPDGSRRSVDARHRMRKRPVDGKSVLQSA
jgi:hypothetical protein